MLKASVTKPCKKIDNIKPCKKIDDTQRVGHFFYTAVPSTSALHKPRKLIEVGRVLLAPYEDTKGVKVLPSIVDNFN